MSSHYGEVLYRQPFVMPPAQDSLSSSTSEDDGYSACAVTEEEEPLAVGWLVSLCLHDVRSRLAEAHSLEQVPPLPSSQHS